MSFKLRGMIIFTSKGNRNLWRRWNKESIIPCQVLVNIWDYGIKFTEKPPDTGMKLGTFLEMLWKLGNSLPKGEYKDATMNLYVDTVQSELFPPQKRSKKIIKIASETRLAEAINKRKK